MKIAISKSRVKEIEAKLRELGASTLVVGFPQEGNSEHPGMKLTTAELAYVHEHGSPASSIPARPFLGPAMEASAPTIEKAQMRIAQAALEGNDPTPLVKALGMKLRDNVKNHLLEQDPKWPEWSPKYAAWRRARGRAGAYKRLVEMTSGKKGAAGIMGPTQDTQKKLILTGEMMRRITFALRRV